MDVRLRELAARQYDVVSAWQLLAAGMTRKAVVHHVSRNRWRAVHSGVYVLTQATLTREQRWIAAALTTPDSVLSHASAAAFYGIRQWRGSVETITRPGSGGPCQVGSLLVSRSSTLAADTTVRGCIPITTPARTVIDLAAHLSGRETARLLREALRLDLLTHPQLLAALERHHGRRGTGHLRELAARYAEIPYARARSNAEARALEILHDAGERPLVNVRINGEEADLVFPERRLIVEIDGPQYHRFPDEDARKQRRWEAAGYSVRRLPSDAVYGERAPLLELIR